MSIDALIKASKKVAGLSQVAKAIERDKAYSVYVAKDVDAKLLQPILSLCEHKGLEVFKVSSKTALGKACGVKNGAAAAAVLL